MQDTDVEVTVTMHRDGNVTRLDDSGWPIGFREKFFGAYPDAPDEPEELALREPDL